MKHLTTFSILIICIAIFTNCSKKTTPQAHEINHHTDYFESPEVITRVSENPPMPTETWHPTKTEGSQSNGISMVSSDPPNVVGGIFWIGPSTDHSFSIETGSISLSGVYALNNNAQLKKDAYGNLMFYPTKSLSDIEFFKSEIGNLEHEEGYLYKVEGSKYYLGSELWGVVVTKILQKVEAENRGNTAENMIVDASNNSATNTNTSKSSQKAQTTKTTKTTKRWQNTKSTNNEEEWAVSKNPPIALAHTYWVNSSKNGTIRTKNGPMSYSNCFVLNEIHTLEKGPDGGLVFSNGDPSTLEFMCNGEVSGLDYEEGYFYKVQGYVEFEGMPLDGRAVAEDELILSSVSVYNVLQKVKDQNYVNSQNFTPTETWHPQNDLADGANNKSKTTGTTERWQTTKKTTKSSTSTNTTKRTKTNKRWQNTKTKKGQSETSSEVEDFTPTETRHPNQNIADGADNKTKKIKITSTTQRWKNSKTKIKSTTTPSILDGIFWIGSTRNHSFSMEVGAMSVVDAYAINLSHVGRKLSGEISSFYPINNMDNLDFYQGEIENLDYEEGNYYKVDGSLHYVDEKLSKVSVNRVLEKVKDNSYSVKDRNYVKNGKKNKNYGQKSEEDSPQNLTPTETWHPSNNKDSNSEEVSMVSKDPPSYLEGTFWIGSSKHVSHSTPKGNIKANNCYVINNKQNLEKDPYGGLVFYSNSDVYGMELLCQKINGFEYEEGYYYQVKGTKIYGGKKLKGISVDKVLRKVEDEDYVKIEDMVLYVGPGKATGYAFNGQEMECLQVQYDKYSRSAELSAYCNQIAGFDPEPGYLYTLKIRRTHKSKRERKMVADDFSLNDKLITIVKMQRVQ